MSFKPVFIAVLIFVGHSLAQTSEELIISEPIKKFSVFADATSFLLKGAGVKASYSINQNFAIGAVARKFELSNAGMDDGVFDPKSEVTAFGVVGDYFLNSSDVAGAYGSVAYVNHKVETTVNGSLVNGATAEDKQSGLQVKAGYQFLGQITPQFDLLFQLGLGYGVGGAIKSSAESFNQTAQTDLKSSVLLDLSVGTHF